jgi:hypothetical protein
MCTDPHAAKIPEKPDRESLAIVFGFLYDQAHFHC